ncbi:MAG: cache domain-containing protein, partial [Desulfofustis sp.]|nr:cache domain-containing protein [Desulfofustis sp.]
MSPNKFRDPKGIFYASPLLFACACVLLTVIIGVFAVNNVQREKQLMTSALSQEGQAILNLLASSTRANTRRSLMRGELDDKTWRQTIRQVIENGSDHPGIAGLFLVTAAGEIIAHSEQDRDGTMLPEETTVFLKQAGRAGEQFRIVVDADGREVFQLAMPFVLVGTNQMMPHVREMARGRMGRLPDRPYGPDLERFFEQVG